MRTLPDNSVDAVVTDPPYGWRFMGKAWDGADIERMTKERMAQQQTLGKNGVIRASPRCAPSESAGKYDNSLTANQSFQEFSRAWAVEAFRVLKPGGHMLVFCGPRTYHRMASGVEDAGFEIRDQLQWLFGSGFPKSHDVSKGIDKMYGAQREVIGQRKADDIRCGNLNHRLEGDDKTHIINLTAPSTPDAIKWQGWGTALKPANEPIVLARKPLSESTVAKNVLKWGCGALNIDGSRIGTEVVKSVLHKGDLMRAMKGGESHSNPSYTENVGRWPANVLFDEEAAKLLDEQSVAAGIHSAGKARIAKRECEPTGNIIYKHAGDGPRFGDTGGASRFFYCAKASKSERNRGLENETKNKEGTRPHSPDNTGKFPDHDQRETGGNNHPTVKPIKLMEYLCRLITPSGGIILDPFAGSGTTGCAAKNLGFDFIGIEQNPEYVAIAEKRIAACTEKQQLELA